MRRGCDDGTAAGERRTSSPPWCERSKVESAQKSEEETNTLSLEVS